ncbi:MAG: carboxylating nicotinate-nucleotide diphosphorylase [Pseudomonadota bacterium]
MQINQKEIDRIIDSALSEDIGKGDITANLLIPETAKAHLVFKNREAMIMGGGFIVPQVFARLNPHIICKVNVEEGKLLEQANALIEVSGQGRAILSGERVALNLLQRISSIATNTAKYVQAVKGTNAIILDTRKTIPGLREIDKYGVRIGGGQNHRMRLDDAILIKDNHIAICGGISGALQKAIAGNSGNLPIEIECDTIEQFKQALAAGATRIMLDNMPPEKLSQAVKINAGKAKLEASGNVNLQNIRKIAETGVDFISIGRLTHSVSNVDIGLDIEIEG